MEGPSRVHVLGSWTGAWSFTTPRTSKQKEDPKLVPNFPDEYHPEVLSGKVSKLCDRRCREKGCQYNWDKSAADQKRHATHHKLVVGKKYTFLQAPNTVPPAFFVMLDGGPDESPKLISFIFLLGRLWRYFDLDLLAAFTHTAGDSKHNCMETPWGETSELIGTDPIKKNDQAPEELKGRLDGTHWDGYRFSVEVAEPVRAQKRRHSSSSSSSAASSSSSSSDSSNSASGSSSSSHSSSQSAARPKANGKRSAPAPKPKRKRALVAKRALSPKAPPTKPCDYCERPELTEGSGLCGIHRRVVIAAVDEPISGSDVDGSPSPFGVSSPLTVGSPLSSEEENCAPSAPSAPVSMVNPLLDSDEEEDS